MNGATCSNDDQDISLYHCQCTDGYSGKNCQGRVFYEGKKTFSTLVWKKFAHIAGCNACYVGETTRHFSTRVREHLVSDRASHIFKHLQNSEHCRTLCSQDCFHILDHASTSFQLKIKEANQILREKPSLRPRPHEDDCKRKR